MHTIRHIFEPSRLPLVWQDPTGESRDRLVVGELRREESELVFSYCTGSPDFEKAEQLGFRGYPAFRKFDQTYREGVAEAFLRRIPPRKRTDFDKYLDNFRLPTDSPITDLALLAYSGAKLPSDGFSFVHPFDGVSSDCELLMEVAGFRHQSQIPLQDLNVGALAEFEPEPENPFDANSVKVLIENKLIGYVNRIQTTSFNRWISSCHLRAWVERLNGRPERPLVYLFVEVRSAADEIKLAG